jgi:Outer membrane protein beta-barrel domain
MRAFLILFIVGFTFIVNHNFVNAQLQKPENYSKFDARLLHFGVQLGLNSNNFLLVTQPSLFSKYKYTSINTERLPGAQVGMVVSLKCFTPIIRLRFVPTFSFIERVIKYQSLSNEIDGKIESIEKRINSSNLDFPLMLQLRTLRSTNFDAYCLGGIQYTYDLQSMADKTQNFVDPFIKLKKQNLMLQAGGGVEFFAEYFKFGIELKYSYGFQDVLIQDATVFSSPLKYLRNNSWIFSITFEG